MTKSAPTSERPSVIVELPTPIKRGDTEITSLTLRKPRGRDLRGTTLSEIIQTKVDSIIIILPRVSEPSLTQHEADEMEPENLLAVAGELVGFFLTAEERARLEAM